MAPCSHATHNAGCRPAATAQRGFVMMQHAAAALLPLRSQQCAGPQTHDAVEAPEVRRVTPSPLPLGCIRLRRSAGTHSSSRLSTAGTRWGGRGAGGASAAHARAVAAFYLPWRLAGAALRSAAACCQETLPPAWLQPAHFPRRLLHLLLPPKAAVPLRHPNHQVASPNPAHSRHSGCRRASRPPRPTCAPPPRPGLQQQRPAGKWVWRV